MHKNTLQSTTASTNVDWKDVSAVSCMYNTKIIPCSFSVFICFLQTSENDDMYTQRRREKKALSAYKHIVNIALTTCICRTKKKRTIHNYTTVGTQRHSNTYYSPHFACFALLLLFAFLHYNTLVMRFSVFKVNVHKASLYMFTSLQLYKQKNASLATLHFEYSSGRLYEFDFLCMFCLQKNYYCANFIFNVGK